ncbi:hypothetical protein Avbf_15438 [Armadillidium vulgare]|nr:hypothetical protein Avbf_15438 [Armadillidium vulgare]
MLKRKSSAKNKIEVRDIEKKDLLNDQICGKGGNEEGTFSTFIDVNSEIEVKEEPLDFKEEDVLADTLSDQVFELHENQEKIFTFIDINSEIKINDVPSYIKEEEELNDPFFEKIPGLFENQKCDSTEKADLNDSDEEEMTTSKRELEESEEKNAGLLKRKKITSQLPELASSDEDIDRVDETCNNWDNMQGNQHFSDLSSHIKIDFFITSKHSTIFVKDLVMEL